MRRKLMCHVADGVPVYADDLCGDDECYYIDLREEQFSGRPFPELDEYGYACLIPNRYAMLKAKEGNLPDKLLDLLEAIVENTRGLLGK